ncbi:MAG TPA: nicotinate-nucleotide adenylyltransferase [Candidatus Eisenbacteria bacterium]|nr:nicotinate-nucleotide adenylyltransferase [Candidatus Eisenbacteria bacterium]
MRIAIFGGRFDPIHNGHLAVAQEVLRVGKVDEVWLSVENQHQWRPIVASSADRVAMLELAIDSVIPSGTKDIYSSSEHSESRSQDSSQPPVSNNNRLKVDTTPLELGGSTATLFVMRSLREKFPQHEFVFVVGSDQLGVFYKWTFWEDLEKEVHFLVVARKGSPMENVPKNATIITDATYEPLEDSATRIRDLLGAGKSITGLVPKSVEGYIIQHKLYR